jgi:large repetitive protein
MTLTTTSIGFEQWNGAPTWPNGIIGRWNLSEGSGTTATDSSSTANNGTIAAGTWTTGHLGTDNAWATTSTAKITVPANSAYTALSSGVTLSCWAKLPTTVPGYGTLAVLASSPSWSNGFGLAADNSGNLLFFINNWSTSRALIAHSSYRGAWHHYAGTYDQSNIRLYVDGSQVASAAYSTAMSVPASPISIGNFTGAAAINGPLQLFKLWNRALSASEASALFSAGG